MIGINNLGMNGRLGNQMFQYASLVGISHNLNYDYIIPDNQNCLSKCFYLNSCSKRGLMDGDEVILHDSHEFSEDLFNGCPDGVTLTGYFQTEKYFKNVDNIIRDDFTFKKEIHNEVDFYFKKYLDQEPVSIIIRHYNNEFDYPGCEYNHRNIPLEYYKNAIEMMGKNKIYIICSNNIELYKNYFVGPNFIFSDINTKTKKSYFDLCLASKCKDFIISNSTFAWWAAWLGEGKVISPFPWYGPGLSHISTDDLYLDTWNVIKC